MSYIRSHARLLLVAVSCAAAGAAASIIATAGAATANSTHAVRGARIARARRLRRIAARTVHGTLVVRTRSGFATVTFDRGRVDSVSGRRLTMTEGTPKATFKTVTLTIPANARVRDNRQKATLAQVKPGQRVIVVTAPRRTFVLAHAPGFRRGVTP